MTQTPATQTPATQIGVLHPGEMGAAIGAVLRGIGLPVCWAGAGRSAATTRRATAAALRDAGTVADVCSVSDVIISICPPHAALDVAASVAAQGFSGIYLDANAISPGTAMRVAATVSGTETGSDAGTGSDAETGGGIGGADYVDGGVVGAPPNEQNRSRLYVSGSRAAEVAALFDGGPLEVIALDGGPTAASALKMTYAAWTKGSAALLLALRAAARGHGVEDALLAEWARSQPLLADRSESALRSAQTKGWRWTAEMTEIARTFADADQPAGFHEAAAEVYQRYERPAD